MEWMLMPLKRYADFSGRSRRMEFWMWQLAKFLVGLVIFFLFFVLVGSALLSGDPTQVMAAGGVAMVLWLLTMVLGLAIIIPDIAVTVRRLHDTDRSGWWILAPVAPYLLVLVAGTMMAASPDSFGMANVIALIGVVAAIGLAIMLLVFYFLEGTKGPNRFGPDPKAPESGQVFA